MCFLSLFFNRQVLVNCNLENVISVSTCNFSRAAGGQGYGPEVCGRGVWRQHQADTVTLPATEDAADPAGERHHRRVHQE